MHISLISSEVKHLWNSHLPDSSDTNLFCFTYVGQNFKFIYSNLCKHHYVKIVWRLFFIAIRSNQYITSLFLAPQLKWISVLTKWIYWEIECKHCREGNMVYIIYLGVYLIHFCTLINKAFQRYTELILPSE